MVINNNLIAMQAQGMLSIQKGKLEKQLRKVSSGEKLSSAGDAAAEYAISEKMRAQIRSLEQTSLNLRQGENVTRAAMGGLDGIYDILATVKEKTLDSANDTNTNDDRRIMQREVDELLRQVDELAYGTEMNGVKPLCVSKIPGVPAGGYYHEPGNITLTPAGRYMIDAPNPAWMPLFATYLPQVRIHDGSSSYEIDLATPPPLIYLFPAI